MRKIKGNIMSILNKVLGKVDKSMGEKRFDQLLGVAILVCLVIFIFIRKWN